MSTNIDRSLFRSIDIEDARPPPFDPPYRKQIRTPFHEAFDQCRALVAYLKALKICVQDDPKEASEMDSVVYVADLYADLSIEFRVLQNLLDTAREVFTETVGEADPQADFEHADMILGTAHARLDELTDVGTKDEVERWLTSLERHLSGIERVFSSHSAHDTCDFNINWDTEHPVFSDRLVEFNGRCCICGRHWQDVYDAIGIWDPHEEEYEIEY